MSTTPYKQVKEWMTSFGQGTPAAPTMPERAIRLLRAKLILEEAIETVTALGFDPVACIKMLGIKTNLNGHGVQWEFRDNAQQSLHSIFDGIVDMSVVGLEGTAIACGFSEEMVDKAYQEVMRSNFSKMWTKEDLAEKDDLPTGWTVTPVGNDRFIVKNELGKVVKSPTYSPANLTQFFPIKYCE